jgi:RimJ/RimL family protein N-acetyltransferase
LDALHALWIDADVRRYLWDGEVISRERAEATVRAGIESFERNGFGFWGLFEKGSAPLIGFCGLRVIGETSDVELLYGIDPRLWRRGYATEAAHAVLRWAFEFTDLQRIFAGADPPNPASLRVVENLGMRFAGNRATTAGDTPYWVIEREDFPGSGRTSRQS